MSVEVMRTVIEAAEGRVPVDTLFTNAQIVDVYGQRVAPGSVAVKDGVIVGVLYDGRDDAAGTYEATEVIDCQGRYLAPGFIDGHLHIESSNIRPAEYARMAATRGTTTAIADSHEIANVAGLDGLRFMIEDGRRAPISIKYMMPSCVPALPDEQADARLGHALRRMPVLFLLTLANLFRLRGTKDKFIHTEHTGAGGNAPGANTPTEP